MHDPDLEDFVRAATRGWKSKQTDPVLAELDFPVWPDDYSLPG